MTIYHADISTKQENTHTFALKYRGYLFKNKYY